MSDENPNQNPPAEGNPAPSEPAKEPSFSAADVERILAADREQRAASAEPDDPVAKFRATTHGTKLYSKPKAQPAQPAQPQGSRLESLVESLVALQVASMKPPAPPAPPKPMSAREKLASADEGIWLRRGNANEWSGADRAALIAEHAEALRKQGFAGNVEAEAESRARKEVVAAGQKALANIRISPGMDLSMFPGHHK